MEEHHRKWIEQIVNSIECPRDFACYKNQSRPLCTTRDVAIDGYVAAEGNHGLCKYKAHFAGGSFCQCPLCVYLTKNNLIGNEH